MEKFRPNVFTLRARLSSYSSIASDCRAFRSHLRKRPRRRQHGGSSSHCGDSCHGSGSEQILVKWVGILWVGFVPFESRSSEKSTRIKAKVSGLVFLISSYKRVSPYVGLPVMMPTLFFFSLKEKHDEGVGGDLVGRDGVHCTVTTQKLTDRGRVQELPKHTYVNILCWRQRF